jgi:hypothetical protein
VQMPYASNSFVAGQDKSWPTRNPTPFSKLFSTGRYMMPPWVRIGVM